MGRNPNVQAYLTHEDPDPDFQLHSPDVATTAELELPPLLAAKVLVG